MPLNRGRLGSTLKQWLILQDSISKKGGTEPGKKIVQPPEVLSSQPRLSLA